MSSSPPSTLGQYQIIREIARSNDIVYEAYDPLMNRRVAVKELALPAGLTPVQKDERISRFKREAQAAGTLNHPNIMTVYSFAEDAGRHFMAMEYLDGCTLRNEIDTKGFLPPDRAIEIAIAVLEGLSHAHSKGVIHRDIKPDNIQLLSNGGIKITDFGIARLTFQPNLTLDGQVFGTPSYMSPEQVVGKEIDQRSDLFSVGVLLYEMVSGQKPFTGDSVVTISYAIMNKEPQQPSQVGYELWAVIRKALEKTAQMRYLNADEFVQALREVLRQQMSPMPDPVASPYNYSAPSPYLNQPVPSAPTNYPANPYLQAPQQQSVPPPQLYAPQFPPPQQGFPSQQSLMGQGNPYYTQAPIYYPPPPRKPLLKPEQIQFLKSLSVSIVLVGTLFMIVIVGMQQLGSAIERVTQDSDRDKIETQMTDRNSRVPAERRIAEMEKIEGRYRSEADKAHYRRVMAALHELAGKDLLNREDAASKGEIENHFNSTIKLDPNNPAGYADLAAAYEAQAMRQNVNPPYDGSVRGIAFANAARNWIEAAKRADSNDRAKYAAAAARDAIQYAENVIQFSPEKKDEAAQLMSAAQQYLPSDSQESAAIRQEIIRLG